MLKEALMSKIHGVNGPIIRSKDVQNFKMYEMVYVSDKKILGEVIGIDKSYATIQIYEASTNLKIGDTIYHTQNPLSVRLGPGLLGNIFDGIGRPLIDLKHKYGNFLNVGQNIDPKELDANYTLTPLKKDGETVFEGEVIATFPETQAIEHRVLAQKSGTLSWIKTKDLSLVEDTYKIDDTNYSLSINWPIRHERKVSKKLESKEPLITGQRVIDTMFPIIKGGAAAIPGGFGAGKTMLQHQLAKYCDADVIVYVGCGERGNEMAQVLQEFGELIDPKTGHSLLDRTILIANTSNMPVAAREASIYTGITYAEYYRDMGYHVALMADSTSRWAEGLRELSGRLEEMPAEEGFPAYLASRLAQFYERASFVETLNHDIGSISLIGAISPQGADFSEPVTQNTQRFIGCFWALDKNLAYIRHFPSVNYNNSYSEYTDALKSWYKDNVSETFYENRQRFLTLLNEETQLMEIVKLIGQDILADKQRLTLEMGRLIRVGFLQQNAFHPKDASVSLQIQDVLMTSYLYMYDASLKLIEEKHTIRSLINTHLFEDLIAFKYNIEDPYDSLQNMKNHIDQTLQTID